MAKKKTQHTPLKDIPSSTWQGVFDSMSENKRRERVLKWEMKDTPYHRAQRKKK